MSEEKPSTLTIKVIVRHSKACRKSFPGLTLESRECNCRKSLWIYENGKDTYISARTRSWEDAERFALAEMDRRNPDKQKVKELEEQLAQKKADEAAKTLSIKDATDRWLASMKLTKEGSITVVQSMIKRILAWAEDNNIQNVADVNPDNLDLWRSKWSPVSEESYNQMAPETQKHFRSYLRRFFQYIVDLDCYITKNPAAKLKPIKGSSARTKPLTQSQFQELMTAIVLFCAAQTGIRGGR